MGAWPRTGALLVTRGPPGVCLQRGLGGTAAGMGRLEITFLANDPPIG